MIWSLYGGCVHLCSPERGDCSCECANSASARIAKAQCRRIHEGTTAVAEKKVNECRGEESKHKDNHALLSQWNAVQDDVSSTISIDCGSAKDTCAELDVVSVPAIRLYHGENMFRFRGPRKASSITSFLRRLQSPAMTRLSEEDYLQGLH